MDAPAEKDNSTRDNKSAGPKNPSESEPLDRVANTSDISLSSSAWGPWWQFGIAWLVLTVGVALYSPNFVWPENTSDAGTSPFGSDFLQEWIGGNILNSQNASQLYDKRYFKQQQHTPELVGFAWDEKRLFPPVYPPTHYTLFIPLSQIPYRTAVYIWLAISMGSLWLACLGADKISEITHPIAPNSSTVPIKNRIHRFWILGIFFPPLLATVTMGQKGIIFLAICTTASLTWKLKQQFATGLLLGILTVKPTLLIFVPAFFLWQRAWAVLAGTLTTTFLLVALAVLVCPTNLWQDYLQFAIQADSYQQSTGYHSGWSASILSVLSLVSLDSRVLKLGVWLVTFAFGCFALNDHRKRTNASARTIYSIVIFSMLLSPHFFFYDMVLFLLPLRLMFDAERTRVTLHGVLIAMAAFYAQHGNLDFPFLPFVLLLLVIDLHFGPAMDRRIPTQLRSEAT